MFTIDTCRTKVKLEWNMKVAKVGNVQDVQGLSISCVQVLMTFCGVCVLYPACVRCPETFSANFFIIASCFWFSFISEEISVIPHVCVNIISLEGTPTFVFLLTLYRH